MPLLKDSKVKVKRDFPRSAPEKQVALYLENKQQRKSVKRFPKWDIPPENVTTKIVEASRELQEVETKLNDVKMENTVKRMHLDEQWNELEHYEREFKNAFIKYNEFLKENAEKRERCKIKINADKKVIKRRKEQIDTLKEKFDFMLDIKRQMETMIKKHAIYEEFLHKVVDISPNFNNIDDIVRRYDDLMQARNFILHLQEQAIGLLESAERDISFLIEAKTNEYMALINKINMMQSRYENAKQKSKHWEKILENIKQHVGKSYEDVANVKSTTWNLYQNMCLRKGDQVVFEEWDIENQLLYIKTTLKNFESIVAITKTITVKPKPKYKVDIWNSGCDEKMPVNVVWLKSNYEQEIDKKIEEKKASNSISNISVSTRGSVKQ